MQLTCSEFFALIKSHNVWSAPRAADRDIMMANMRLQNMRAAMLPKFMLEIYSMSGGLNIGAGYIFGPTEFMLDGRFPVPSLADANQAISALPQMRALTLFGRNDLFWFAFDAFGTCSMLDNLTLRPLRKYDDAYRAAADCLIGGKL